MKVAEQAHKEDITPNSHFKGRYTNNPLQLQPVHAEDNPLQIRPDNQNPMQLLAATGKSTLNKSITISGATLQAKFWEANDAGNYIWHNEEPDPDNFVDAGKKYGRPQDWFSWPVHFPANSLRGRLKASVEEHGTIEGPPGLDNLQKACWNWALTGFTDEGVYPQKILDYLRVPGQIAALRAEGFDVPAVFNANDWALENLPERQGRQWFIDNKGAIDQIWNEYETDIVDRDADTVNFETVEKLVRQSVVANGFVISPGSPYQICMHYKKADGVTFDHWWIKVDDIVLETFPGRQLPDGRFQGLRDIQITGTEQEHVSNDGEQMGVVRVNVQSLKAVQVNHIQAALDALHA